MTQYKVLLEICKRDSSREMLLDSVYYGYVFSFLDTLVSHQSSAFMWHMFKKFTIHMSIRSCLLATPGCRNSATLFFLC